jgi:hypothetical protein
LLAAGVAVFESDELVEVDVDAEADVSEADVDDVLAEDDEDGEAAASVLFLESRLSVR